MIWSAVLEKSSSLGRIVFSEFVEVKVNLLLPERAILPRGAKLDF